MDLLIARARFDVKTGRCMRDSLQRESMPSALHARFDIDAYARKDEIGSSRRQGDTLV
jgi:hypothetical protein